MTSNIYFWGKDGEKSRKRRGKEKVNVRFDLCFGIKKIEQNKMYGATHYLNIKILNKNKNNFSQIFQKYVKTPWQGDKNLIYFQSSNARGGLRDDRELRDK